MEFGGIERVVLSLLEHQEPGIELCPIVYTRTDMPDTTFGDRLSALGNAHFTIHVNGSRAKYLNPLRNVRETMAVFRRERFDVIHSHGYRADLIALAVAKRFGLPVVSTCHGFIGTDRRLDLYNRLDLFLLRSFTRVIAVSDSLQQHLVSHGVRAERIHVITNAVGDAAPAPDARPRIRALLELPEDAFLFGFVGRLSEEKGVDDLLQALAGMSDERRTGHVLLVGGGPRRDTLERSVRALGLDGRVHFAGFQPDPSSWYSAMDAFVLPSLTEGTPMALLEAMAHGLPCIATSVGGVPDVLSDRRNGLLVPSSDPVALASAMRRVLADHGFRSEMGAAGRRSVRERYDVRTWVRRTRAVYEAAAAPAER